MKCEKMNVKKLLTDAASFSAGYANLSNPFASRSVARACGYAAEILLEQIEKQEQNV